MEKIIFKKTVRLCCWSYYIVNLGLLIHFHMDWRKKTDTPYFAEKVTDRCVGKLLPLYFKYNHDKHDNSDIFVLLGYLYQLSGKYGKTWFAVLGRKFPKLFPFTVVKCWRWPRGEFWNLVALVQTNTACSLGLLCTQTINITPVLQISHLFIYLNKLRIHIWTESAFSHIANFHHSL